MPQDVRPCRQLAHPCRPELYAAFARGLSFGIPVRSQQQSSEAAEARRECSSHRRIRSGAAVVGVDLHSAGMGAHDNDPGEHEAK